MSWVYGKVIKYSPIILEEMIRVLEKAKTYFDKTKTISYGYEDLTPTEKADEDGKYSELLNWTLSNQKIKNIAITGTYGSGKSSLLNTFKENNLQFQYLNISLASFKNMEEQTNNNDEKETKDSSIEIEKNILLQLFYKVKKHDIPYSRFNKIEDVKTWKLMLDFAVFLFVLLSGVFFIIPNTMLNLYKENLHIINEVGFNEKIVNIIGLCFIFCSFCLVYRIFKFVKCKIKVNKIKFDKTELEIDKKDTETSILNKHIDEILYFFEVTNYNVVIFEDLDRFNNSVDVFTKLREINMLLNSSEQITRKVVFIYALRDDVFSDSEKRTKFFDFIIPVIPVVNSSNSCEVLKTKFKEKGVEIEESFIRDITLYVKDMRTLINICNEFILYKEKLGGLKLNLKNLLAMIVYKNIEPKDFAELQNGRGIIHDIFKNKKSVLVLAAIKEADQRIEAVEAKLKDIEQEWLEKIDELQAIYWMEIWKRTTNTYFTFNGNVVQNNAINEFFSNNQLSRSDKFGFSQYNSNYDFYTADGTKPNFFDRRQIIQEGKKNIENNLKDEISKLKRQKAIVRKMSVQELLLKSDANDVFSNEVNNKALLSFLIRNGHINEMYQNYITYFYPGSLTEDDMTFIRSVKSKEALPWEYSLSNCKEIIEWFNMDEFKRSEVLNYDLVEFLLENRDGLNYEIFIDELILQLKNKSDNSVRFIDEYIENGKNDSGMIFELCKKWSGMWKFLEMESGFSKDKLLDYLLRMIKFANIDDIVNLNDEDRLLSKYISAQEDFFSILDEEHDVKKVKELIEKLGIVFTAIAAPYSDIEKELFDFVYETSLYEINSTVIRTIIEYKCSFDDDNLSRFKRQNYTFLKQSKCDILLAYIEKNIQTYIQKVFLAMESNIEETEESVLNLLNRDEVDMSTKIKIFVKESVMISDINKVEDENLWEELFKKEKVGISWKNVISYYMKKGEIEDVFVDFVNEHYAELSKLKLNNEGIWDESNYKKVAKNLILCEKISDLSFDELKKSLPWEYLSFDIAQLSEKRIDSMIDGKILRLSEALIIALKEKYDEKHIRLIEKNINEFIGVYDKYKLESNDIQKLLISNEINDTSKIQIIKCMKTKYVIENKAVAEEVFKFCMKREFGELDTELFVDMTMSEFLSVEEKIELICKTIGYLRKDVIEQQLALLAEPYSQIVTGSSPYTSIDNNKINQKLVEVLVKNKYISSLTKRKNKIQLNKFRV